jgi:hypothetical protein
VEVLDRQLEVVLRDLVARDGLDRLVAAAAASYESSDPDGRDRNQEDSDDDGRSSYRRRNVSELFFQHLTAIFHE